MLDYKSASIAELQVEIEIWTTHVDKWSADKSWIT